MGFSVCGVDHIQVAAPKGSEEAAREFYGGILGLEEIPKPVQLQGRGGCWFVCGNQQLHVGIQEDFVPASKAHPGLLVQNVEALRRKLVNLSLPVKEEPAIDDRIRFFVHDPFGNRIEFLEYKKGGQI